MALIPTFHILVLIAAAVAGGIASIAGFGIGSILTPLLATALGTKLAVAVVSVPHLIATALRFVLIRQHMDRRVFLTFGITSGLGGLAGALLHAWLKSVVLSYILGALLVFAGIMGVSGLASRMRFGRTTGWVAGALSGIFGGLVGNQGGIRSAALFGFDVKKESFVATATAIALLVDGFRMPVYAATQFHEIGAQWKLMLLGSAGVVLGTIAGQPLLRRIPERTFRAVVGAIILALGVWMLARPSA
ncbi:MAG TPA: sulfite exporter TauE/SafE family protein [Terriglobales bacterium]|nr:sulfite exporter TauE/SafE family protein [Terriglobales bacterium]